MIPNLEKLKNFYYVAETGKISRASKLLKVTRSAVSQQIKNLEDELNTQLFIRSGPSIILTREGYVLHEALSPLLNSIENVVKELQGSKKELYGILKIGAPLEFTTNFLSKLIADFRLKNPGVRFDITLGIPPILVSLLISNKLDMCFIDAGDVFERMHPISTRKILIEDQILTCSRTYYKDHIHNSKNHTYENLSNLDFISHVEQATEIFFWFKHHFSKVPRRVELSVISDSIRTNIAFTKQGLGLALIPTYLIKNELKTNKLVRINTYKEDYRNMIKLAQLPNKKPLPIERAFVQFCSEFFFRNHKTIKKMMNSNRLN